MGVNIKINSTKYPIACAEGDEVRISLLGEYVQKKIDNLGSIPSSISESQLLVMACLLLADESNELQEEIKKLRMIIENRHHELDATISASYEKAIGKIDELIAKL